MRGLLKKAAARLPLHRWLRPAGGPVLAVLMYHDLRDDTDFPNWMRVAVSDFRAQLDDLARLGDFVGPEVLAAPARLSGDRISFLLTFDDGYANNARLAQPLLEERGIPALFFVSTGPLASREPFWTDVVVTPVQALGLEELDLTAHGLGIHRFAPGPSARRWEDVQRLLVAVKALGNEDHPPVAELLADLRARYADVLAEHLPRFRPLTAQEIAAMARGGCCRIGSHGREHRILTRLEDDDLSTSLADSRAVLERITGSSVDQLAYPNGDHDARVRRAAAAAGYTCGHAVRPGLVAGGVEAFDLPRIAVGAFDTTEVLRYKLARQLLALRRTDGPRDLRLVRDR